MKKYSIILFSLFLPFFAEASHIAGADFTYRYTGVNAQNLTVYEVIFNLYQDCKNGDQTAIKEDNPAIFSLFRKSDGVYIRSYSIKAAGNPSRINNGVDEFCFDNLPVLCLQNLEFKFNLALPALGDQNYDANGYILSYQRCCRNNVLSNIANPAVTGTTFFTEIPAVTTNNSARFNSPPPLIICNEYEQNIDYSCWDPDGDSLDYYLCTSYVGGTRNNPKPNKATSPPYSGVTYNAPYSATEPFSSSTTINLDPKTGRLYFKPDRLGIFSVVVCVDEYRGGVKVGSNHRETQFYITGCSKKSYADIPFLADETSTHQIVCDGYTVHFGNRSSGTQSYLWNFGDPNTTNDFSNLKFPSYTYPDTGVYNVVLYTDYDRQCPDSVSKLVKVYPYFEAGFIKDGGSCPNKPVTFIDTTFSTLDPVNFRQWQLGDGVHVFGDSIVMHEYANATGEYNVTLIVKSAKGCVDTARKIVPILGVNVFAGHDTTVVKDVDVLLGARAEDTISWIPEMYLDDPHKENPVFNFPTSGEYTYVLFSMNEAGCFGRDTVHITVTDKSYFFIPNAFSPNGDNLNDFIDIKTSGIRQLLSFTIFNRWGQELLSTTNLNQIWNGQYQGKPLDIGTYFWVAEAINLKGERIIERGEINLIR